MEDNQKDRARINYLEPGQRKPASERQKRIMEKNMKELNPVFDRPLKERAENTNKTE